jgi:nickel-dependent lactate racemase
MRRPTAARHRGRAAAAGVDDVQLIAALALHRRMTESELRHAVGDRVYDAFAPSGRIYNHDAEDPDGMLEIGTTKHGELVEINKRAAESDLLIYVNVNLVSMDGGWKSTATGLAGTGACAITTTCRRCSTAAASWTATAPSCTAATGAWARCCATPA